MKIGGLSHQRQSLRVQIYGSYNPMGLYLMFAVLYERQTTAVMIGDCDKHSKIRAVFYWLILGGADETKK